MQPAHGRRAGVALATIVLPILQACGRGESQVQAAGAQGKPPIVLVVVDTLRADHLGCYGYGRPTSPRIDALAEQGVLFERVMAQSTWTKPTTASILTGLYPSRHGASSAYIRLDAAHETVAEVLQAEGYSTAAFGFNPHVFGATGFSQGFEIFQSPPPESPRLASARASVIVDRALEWLAQRPADKPFFLYVHLFDPHDPYDPPEPFRSRLDRGVRGRYDAWHMSAAGASAEDLAPEDWSHMIDLYDGEIAYADFEVGRLLDALDLERTAVFLLADHGEEFFEHGGWNHGTPTLHEELLHVPLIASLPPLRAQGRTGLRVRDLTQQVDLLPTVLDLLGRPARPELPGQSLLALAFGPRPPVVGISEVEQVGHFKKAAVSGSIKYIRSWLPEPREALYDLGLDKKEQRDALGEHPDELALLRSALEQHLAGAPARYALTLENRSEEILTLNAFLVCDGEKPAQGNDFIDCEDEPSGAVDFDGPFLLLEREHEGRIRQIVQFTFRTRPGDLDGVYFTPPPDVERLELYLRMGGDPPAPARVYLGETSASAVSADPAVLDFTHPEIYTSATPPAVRADETSYALHVWRTLDAAYPEQDLDPEVEAALKALGYIDGR